MHLLVCARKFVLHDKLVKNGEWTREHLSPMGHISGQTLGIVGIGNIGRAMGRKAKGLGMNVIAFDPNVSSWDFKEYGIEFVSSINELCKKSDYISLHCPLLESTRKIMSTEQFKLMKKTAYLINCSRGPVVDEKALIEALNNNEIAGAGLDVFEEEPTYPENPLLKMDNVGVTNHYASYSEVAWERAETQLGEEAVRISTDGYPMSLVNPGVKSKLTGKKEKEFFKKNLPTGQYSKIFEPIFVKNMKGSWRFGIDKYPCLLYTSPSPRDRTRSRMPSSA